NSDKSMIFRFEYKTGNIVDTLFNAAKARSCTFKSFDGFDMSRDFTKILLYTASEKIYRNSFKAEYYTFEIKRNLVKPLCSEGKQQIAVFSPNGRMVAFVRDGNIYLKKLDYDSQSEVTKGGERGNVIYGTTSWAYEEEFSLINTLTWAPDNTTLAFLRTDESLIKPYRIQLYEGYCPLMKEYAQYPGEFSYKYPVAGTDCSKTEVYTYTVESRVVKRMNIPIADGGYIPRIIFTKDSLSLAVMTLNREQNILNVYSVNPKSGVSRVLVKETSNTWVDEQSYMGITFYKDFFVIPSMRDGYRHLYQYSANGKLMRKLTSGHWDITKFIGSDGKGIFFYQGNAEGNINSSVYKTDISGKITRLTSGKGYNTAYLNATGTYFVNIFSNITTPPVITLNNAQGKIMKTIYDNKALKGSCLSTKEFFTFKNEDGIILNAYMLKPSYFSESIKYPVIMIHSSIPGSQSVLDKWESPDWRDYMVSNGYLVICVDPRGTGGRGEVFSHCIYRKLGILEAQDQISAAKYISSLSYVDSRNISIYGWSFGGYITLMSMTLGDGIFKSGVAVAPVTDWHFYDAIYTERYMNTPQANDNGYNITSPLKMASKMSGRLLLVSGTADDNVHYQNTLQYSAAMIEAGKQFDMQIYPNCNHSITGCGTRLHLFTRIYDFIKQHTKQ
ncbi:MAG: DPP IV N-terminal domain-containing protein, partial [Bacteroidales bacterium]